MFIYHPIGFVPGCTVHAGEYGPLPPECFINDFFSPLPGIYRWDIRWQNVRTYAATSPHQIERHLSNVRRGAAYFRRKWYHTIRLLWIYFGWPRTFERMEESLGIRGVFWLRFIPPYVSCFVGSKHCLTHTLKVLVQSASPSHLPLKISWWKSRKTTRLLKWSYSSS